MLLKSIRHTGQHSEDFIDNTSFDAFWESFLLVAEKDHPGSSHSMAL